MSEVEITIKLPEELAKEARDLDLLTDAKITELLQAELHRQTESLKRLDTFLDTADQLAAAEPKLTPEDIAAEIEAVRREQSSWLTTYSY